MDVLEFQAVLYMKTDHEKVNTVLTCYIWLFPKSIPDCICWHDKWWPSQIYEWVCDELILGRWCFFPFTALHQMKGWGKWWFDQGRKKYFWFLHQPKRVAWVENHLFNQNIRPCGSENLKENFTTVNRSCACACITCIIWWSGK